MSAPTCPTDCLGELPEVSFSECAPEINNAQIRKIYIANIGYGFNDVTDGAEWAARLAMTNNPAAIRELTVVGDKPKPEASEKKISGDRTIKGRKTHTVNIEIDETNTINYEAMRILECGKAYLMWYADEKYVYGGNAGIKCSINLDHIIDKDSGNIQYISGEAKWSSQSHPDRVANPIAA